MNEAFCVLGQRHCRPCEGGIPALSAETAEAMRGALPGWRIEGHQLVKSWRFANHYEVMAFVNAIAWISHSENHHPEVSFGYAHCTVRYWTHAVGGLTENDFICAAKIEQVGDP